MSATTQYEAIEYLVNLWTDALDIPVYDGPSTTEDAIDAALWVGHDPTDDNGQAVDSQQTWAQLGARRKDEVGTITCTIGAWSGDTSTAGRRQQVAELLSQAEAAHRTDITLGGAVQYSGFGPSVRLYQQLTADGNEVIAVFTVSFNSRI